MADNINKNLNMETLKDLELEQVSGGGAITNSQSQSQPQLKDGECPDLDRKRMSFKIHVPGMKELYDYCYTCRNWGRTYCKKGHF